MNFDALIFDFDGVLLESEFIGNRHLADLLTELGHETTVQDAVTQFVGLSGDNFYTAVARWIGGEVPEAFFKARQAEDDRVMREGIEAVDGAIRFVETLPADLPRAIASSSSTHWIKTHLAHLGLEDNFAPHIYSGKEHVTRGKPAPDIYLHAAQELGVDIRRVAILEDSPVGAIGAVASGAFVIGLAAGRHCHDGHDQLLMDKGVQAIAHNFAEVTKILFG
ncbi:MAG: HAD family phosphatase [Sphingomonadaceae bacterium]|nr:HAD family phosphatase [Sphingomonadaceae bacterium]